jgi:hypothetical protein
MLIVFNVVFVNLLVKVFVKTLYVLKQVYLTCLRFNVLNVKEDKCIFKLAKMLR